ncbi:MAG: TlpA family protein disulfide reductase [Flavobacteriia bacterium]|nr:TlpA family protein disulfide reductase [Flavobacteriia bacterium]
MMKETLAILFASFVAISCSNNSESQNQLAQDSNTSSETWRGVLQMNDSTELPFNFKVEDELFIITNGKEEIVIDSVVENGDTSQLYLPVFQTVFKVVRGENQWNGYWQKLDAENYRMPFTATKDVPYRFESTVEDEVSLPTKWEVTLRAGTDKEKPAIGEFHVEANGRATGTFLTETGDYRFLEGIFDGENLKLSGFDGTHAYFFDATYDGQMLNGTHYSGKTYAQPWTAIPNDTFELSDPTHLTFLKEGYNGVSFELQAPDGSMYAFEGKSENGPTIIQIMGSWCPNCMDETRYFKQLHEKYSKYGLTIIGITYEYKAELSEAKPAIQKMIRDLDIPYTVVFGGLANPESIATTLPMLENFMSYPTSIFIDSKGNVRRIHTGYSGPGTSEFEPYSTETEALIEEMLGE